MPDSLCSIPECGRPLLARGWCSGHYRRWRLNGDPGGLLAPTGLDLASRFWPKVNKEGPVPEDRPELGRCWLWTGCVTGRYGLAAVGDRKRAQAHRVSYELLIGPIPEGLVLDHLCRVTTCVRPAHLEPVTQSENVRRSVRVS